MSDEDKSDAGSGRGKSAKPDTHGRVGEVVAFSRDGAKDAARVARTTVEDPAGALEGRPLLALAGSVALGAFIGALVPVTRREVGLFGPVGRKMQDSAREAATAARQAGQQKFVDLGLDRDHVGGTARGFVNDILAAAADAGATAINDARKRTRQA